MVGRSGRKWKEGNAGREATNTEGRLKLTTKKKIVYLNELTFYFLFLFGNGQELSVKRQQPQKYLHDPGILCQDAELVFLLR